METTLEATETREMTEVQAKYLAHIERFAVVTERRMFGHADENLLVRWICGGAKFTSRMGPKGQRF